MSSRALDAPAVNDDVQRPPSPGRAGVVIASKCAWSLYNFRRNLIGAAGAGGESVIALGCPVDDYGERLTGQGFVFAPIPVSPRHVAPLEDVKLLAAFYRRFRRLKPRVAHMFTIRPVIYGTLAASLAGVPVRICTITGLGHAFDPAGNRIVRALVEALYRLALGRAHTVFFQNQDDRDLFVGRGLVRTGKTRVVGGSGVDLSHFPFLPLRPGLPERPTRFLMVSRVLKSKGVMEFVEAAERLAASGAAAEFRLVGGYDHTAPSGLTDADMARLERSPVRWPGPTDDVRIELAEADVVVLPSYYREGTPRALLEAMATGRPIITANTPGCRDLVRPGVTGECVPPRDSHALAEAMARMVGDVARLQAMGQAARAFVAEHYDEATVIETTLAAYRAG
jgi:glycosyltransferase involved in cell wall biosynthesis